MNTRDTATVNKEGIHDRASVSRGGSSERARNSLREQRDTAIMNIEATQDQGNSTTPDKALANSEAANTFVKSGRKHYTTSVKQCLINAPLGNRKRRQHVREAAATKDHGTSGEQSMIEQLEKTKHQ